MVNPIRTSTNNAILAINNSILKIVLLLYVCHWMISCASLPEKVQKEVNNDNFVEALAILEKESIGANPSKKLKEKDIEAREIYSKSVTEYYSNLIQVRLDEGVLRSALSEAEKGIRLCGWCTELKAIKSDLSAKIQELNALQKKLAFVNTGSNISYKSAKRISEDILPYRNLIFDSPVLLNLYNTSMGSIISHWAKTISELGLKIDTKTISKLDFDLEYFPHIKSETTQITTCLTNFTNLPHKEVKKIWAEKLPDNNKSAIYDLISYFSEQPEYNYLIAINETIKKNWDAWTNQVFIPSLSSSTLSFEAISIAEDILNLDEEFKTSSLYPHIKKAHLQRSISLSSKGRASILALIHLNRYKRLGGDSKNELVKKAQAKISRTLRQLKPETGELLVLASPRINPIMFRASVIALYTEIERKSSDLYRWRWSLNPTSTNKYVIELSKANYLNTSYLDLDEVSSSYLSHYEDVPNPMKEVYKNQLISQELAVNIAENNYNNAVSSHNMFPTSYSLSNVNFAHTNYNMAIDRYNQTVNLYNMTPSTIQREVYLPYSFRQGTVEHGWEIEINHFVGDSKQTYTDSLVDSDFVRIGSKYNDVNQNYRRDDSLSLDTSIENGIGKLYSIANGFVKRFGLHLCDYHPQTIYDHESLEGKITQTLYHPFGIEFSAKCSIMPQWVSDSALNTTLPILKKSPESFYLYSPPKTGPKIGRLNDFSSFHEKHVCEILTDFGRGTGTLISGDGIILTCAHVIMGHKVNALFNIRGKRKLYNCEILFVDEVNDVAILKAIGFSSKTWAKIRLKGGSVKGEKIAAIGNPAIDSELKNEFGLTVGIVSNPSIAIGDTNRIVCDITVASGSSGGPIFSRETGEVIGIVTQISEAGLDIGGSDVSSSGYLCLAAPSMMLPNWLGLAYRE